MESINNVIFSSKAKLQTGFMFFMGKNGDLTLTGDNQLIFTAKGSSHDKDFNLKLSEIAVADFRAADSGKVILYTKNRKTYLLKVSKKRIPSTFSKGDDASKPDLDVRPALDWENHLKSMIDPRLVLSSKPSKE